MYNLNCKLNTSIISIGPRLPENCIIHFKRTHGCAVLSMAAARHCFPSAMRLAMKPRAAGVRRQVSNDYTT